MMNLNSDDWLYRNLTLQETLDSIKSFIAKYMTEQNNLMYSEHIRNKLGQLNVKISDIRYPFGEINGWLGQCQEIIKAEMLKLKDFIDFDPSKQVAPNIKEQNKAILKSISEDIDSIITLQSNIYRQQRGLAEATRMLEKSK